MIELRTLGPVQLTTVATRDANPVLAHPKRLGLVVYLALATPRGFRRRDALFALLWPEADLERARNSLRQALHQIRRALGPDVVTNRGDEEVGLAPDALWCDAVEFERRLAQGDAAGALALYGGDLLPGFHVSGAPEFEDWLDRRRAGLREQAIRAAWAVADERAGAGDPVEAARWARTAAALAPWDEAAQRRLIVLLHRLGDDVGALRAYEAHAARLRAEDESEPDAETQRIAAEIRARPAAAPRAPLDVPAPRAADHTAVADPTGATRPPEPGPQVPIAGPAVFVRRRFGAVLFVAGALSVLAIAAIASRTLGRPHSPRLDSRVVAVAPFRVATTGADLQFLREGAVDLLAMSLSGDGLRAADPRASLSAWRRAAGAGGAADVLLEDALRLASGLGAGRLLVGSVVGRPDRLILGATLHETATGRVLAQATAGGPLDSLPELAERLAAQLLVGESREPKPRLRDLTAATLPALRAYLIGRSAYRQGRYSDATRLLREAADLDTGSAIAALELAQAADWIPGVGNVVAAARARAWRQKDRLTRGDRALLEAVLGPRWPAFSAMRELITGWERAVQATPDRPEAWYELGDQYFHFGDATGRDNAWTRAQAALERAVALDSSYAAPLLHLTQIAIAQGDLARARRHVEQFAALDPDADDLDFVRWRLAVAEGDSATARGIEARIPQLSQRSLALMAMWGQLDGVRIDAAVRAAERVYRSATTAEQRAYGFNLLAPTYQNLGRFRAMQALWRATSANVPDQSLPNAVSGRAILWHGDSAAMAGLADRVLAALPRATPDEVAAALLWRIWTGTPPTGPRLDSVLARAGPSFFGQAQGLNPRLRELLIAQARSESRAAQLLAALDSARLADQAGDNPWLSVCLARLYELRGEPQKALVVLGQRTWTDVPGLSSLAEILAAEGRLAVQIGDTARAERAWRHYLAVRADPDPDVRPRVEAVRAALSRLEQRSKRR